MPRARASKHLKERSSPQGRDFFAFWCFFNGKPDSDAGQAPTQGLHDIQALESLALGLAALEVVRLSLLLPLVVPALPQNLLQSMDFDALGPFSTNRTGTPQIQASNSDAHTTDACCCCWQRQVHP